MTDTTSYANRIREAFNPSPRGVVGLVDDLLALGRDQGLRLDFHDGNCSVRPLDTNGQEPIRVPLPKSVFRAVLARIATLCNEQHPNSVTPYRGEGTLSVATNPPATFHVSFTNTPTEQRLTMMGRTTLREIREALAAAKAGEAKPSPVASTAEELETLARSLEGQSNERPVVPTTANPPVRKA